MTKANKIRLLETKTISRCNYSLWEELKIKCKCGGILKQDCFTNREGEKFYPQTKCKKCNDLFIINEKELYYGTKKRSSK